MAKAKPIVSKIFELQRFPGKGGWTYVVIPGIAQDKKAPFGWVKVKGSIDGYQLKQYKLMPMGEGRLFLPVKATIRKQIRKEAGDSVKVTLYLDRSQLKIPDEIMTCLELEPPHILDTFLSFTESEQKAYVDWILSAKRADTKTSRIVEMMDRLASGLKLHDKRDPTF